MDDPSLAPPDGSRDGGTSWRYAADNLSVALVQLRSCFAADTS